MTQLDQDGDNALAMQKRARDGNILEWPAMSECTDEILISYVNSAKNSLVIVMRLYFLVICV